jgi:thiosulfate reductase cytochrome b subunit
MKITFTRKRVLSTAWKVLLALIALALLIVLAQSLRQLTAVQGFIAQFPGTSTLPEGTPVGIPAWLGWQHFLNTLFIVLIIRTGWQVRTNQRPQGFWTSRRSIRKGVPEKISLTLWLHLSLDLLWVINGVIFYILLFATGQWGRIVPTNWDVIPNALSTSLQYASLDWPADNGWVNYNALQLLFYFVTVFVAAPLAIASGIRMSPAWPTSNRFLSRVYPVAAARAVHISVMVYFVAFIIVHVTLVLATGARKNLNHMYAMNDGDGWAGAIVFGMSMVVVVIAWVLAKPLFIRPIAALFGKVSR